VCVAVAGRLRLFFIYILLETNTPRLFCGVFVFRDFQMEDDDGRLICISCTSVVQLLIARPAVEAWARTDLVVSVAFFV